MLTFYNKFFHSDTCQIGEKRPPKSYSGALAIFETITWQKSKPCNRTICNEFSTEHLYT